MLSEVICKAETSQTDKLLKTELTIAWKANSKIDTVDIFIRHKPSRRCYQAYLEALNIDCE